MHRVRHSDEESSTGHTESPQTSTLAPSLPGPSGSSSCALPSLSGSALPGPSESSYCRVPSPPQFDLGHLEAYEVINAACLYGSSLATLLVLGLLIVCR